MKLEDILKSIGQSDYSNEEKSNEFRRIGYVLSTKKGRAKEAIMALEKACEFYKEDANAWFMLATLRMVAGDKHNAINALLEALRISPKNVELNVFLSRAYYATDQIELAKTYKDIAYNINKEKAVDFIKSTFKEGTSAYNFYMQKEEIRLN